MILLIYFILIAYEITYFNIYLHTNKIKYISFYLKIDKMNNRSCKCHKAMVKYYFHVTVTI